MNLFLYLNTLFFLYNTVSCHTWVSYLKCEDTGSIGYIRGYQSREQISDFDIYMTYLLEGRNKNDLICSPHQREDKYFPNFPKLSCPQGSKVLFEYNTNGHVITDQCLPGDPRGCKQNGHTADTYWSIHMNDHLYPNQLTTLGDVNNNPKFNDDSGLINYITKRQKFNFNDACAHQSSESCIGEFIIPKDILPNRDYQFIWYHILDRNYQAVGEYYTSCFDINIIPSPLISNTTTNKPSTTQPCIKTLTPIPTKPRCT
jgi:hypothetical protein